MLIEALCMLKRLLCLCVCVSQSEELELAVVCASLVETSRRIRYELFLLFCWLC